MALQLCSLPGVVTSILLLGGACSAATENSVGVGEDRGGVKKHPEGSEECRQGNLGENIIPLSAVTGNWPRPAAAKPGVMLALAQ